MSEPVLLRYDVLQVRHPGQGWEDFSTLRDLEEFLLARLVVQRQRWGNVTDAAWRIRRGFNEIVLDVPAPGEVTR